MAGRHRAAGHFRRLGQAALAILLDVLAAETEGACLHGALEVLKALEDPRARAAVCMLARNHDPRIRLEAVRTLRALEPQAADFAPSLGDSLADVRRESVFGLACLGGPEAAVLLAQAAQDASPQVRVAAINGLGMLARPASLQLVRTAGSDAHSSVREMAEWSLRRMASGQPLDLSKSANVISSITAWDGACTNEQIIESLGNLLTDSETEVRREAAVALGRTGREAAIVRLEEAAGSPSTDVAVTMAAVIGLSCHANGAASLARLAQEADLEVRRLAVMALGGANAAVAAEPLYAALASPSAEVRQAAAHSLGRIKCRLPFKESSGAAVPAPHHPLACRSGR